MLLALSCVREAEIRKTGLNCMRVRDLRDSCSHCILFCKLTGIQLSTLYYVPRLTDIIEERKQKFVDRLLLQSDSYNVVLSVFVCPMQFMALDRYNIQ